MLTMLRQPITSGTVRSCKGKRRVFCTRTLKECGAFRIPIPMLPLPPGLRLVVLMRKFDEADDRRNVYHMLSSQDELDDLHRFWSVQPWFYLMTVQDYIRLAEH